MTAIKPGRRLADEHAGLLHEVDRRVQRALTAVTTGRLPVPQLEALLSYLRCEVIDQAVHTESLLYPLVRDTPSGPRVPALVRDHRRLRDLTDELAQAATAESTRRDSQPVAAILHEIRDMLAGHLHTEEAVLAAVTDTCIEDLRRPHRSHDWFVLTEGPVIDLDRMQTQDTVPAVLDRLTRMRSGEKVEVRASRHLGCLRAAFDRRRMCADYGWAYLDEGPRQWRVEIARRVA